MLKIEAMKSVKFTRQELYEMVWKESMLALSKKYNISDVGLKKKCVKLNIPVPPVGYWAKVQFGQKASVLKLPVKFTGENLVYLYLREKRPGEGEGEEITYSIFKKQIECDPRLNLKVLDKLTNPDKLIVAVKDDLLKKDVWKGRDKFIYSSKNNIAICVTPKALDRALRILDTIIKAFRTLNYDFKSKNEKICLVIEGEEFEISFKENSDPGTITDKWGNTEYIPNGKLTFKAEISYTRNEWNDGKTLLEDRISGILTKLILKGKSLKEERIAREKAKKEREERERIAKELQKRKENELIDFKDLLRKSKRHDRAVMIRNYINEFESWATSGNLFNEENRNFIAWARKKADWYDPFIEASDELLEDVDRVKLAFKRRNYW